MKILRRTGMISAVTVCSACLTVGLHAIETGAEIGGQIERERSTTGLQEEQNQQEYGARAQTQTRSGQMEIYEVSELEGIRVENWEGESLGSIDSLAVDLQGEHPSFVVVESGGILGVGGDLRVVPIEAITITRTEGMLGDRQVAQIDITEERWDQIPTHEREEIARLCNEAQARQIYQHYNVNWEQRAMEFGAREHREPTTTERRQQTGTLETRERTEQCELVLTSDLKGRSIQSARQEELGSVDNVVFDMGTGQVRYILIAPDTGFFERTDEIYALDPRSFSRVMEEQVVVELTREQLEQAEVLTQTTIRERSRTGMAVGQEQPRVFRYQRDEITFGRPDRDDRGEAEETETRDRPRATGTREREYGVPDRNDGVRQEGDREFGAPDHARDRDSPPDHARDRDGPPDHARDRDGPPDHARDRDGPPDHARDRDGPPDHARDREFGAPDRDRQMNEGRDVDLDEHDDQDQEQNDDGSYRQPGTGHGVRN